MPNPMTAKLKPAPGLRVTFPGTRTPLPVDGADVELTSYWRERIREGSVVVVEPAAAPAPEAPPPATTTKRK